MKLVKLDNPLEQLQLGDKVACINLKVGAGHVGTVTAWNDEIVRFEEENGLPYVDAFAEVSVYRFQPA